MNIHGQESLNRERTGEATLESWKEIAAYLQRQVRTVRRWEKEEGLPVHRHAHKVRGSVYAYPSELDAWRGFRLGATGRGGGAICPLSRSGQPEPRAGSVAVRNSG